MPDGTTAAAAAAAVDAASAAEATPDGAGPPTPAGVDDGRARLAGALALPDLPADADRPAAGLAPLPPPPPAVAAAAAWMAGAMGGSPPPGMAAMRSSKRLANAAAASGSPAPHASTRWTAAEKTAGSNTSSPPAPGRP